MTLNVISNFAANVAHQNLLQSQQAATESLAKLSSGQRIVNASDDPASLAIGDQLQAEVSALNQASVNASQATSVLQIADGAYSNINSILVRLKTLAVQASSGQLSGTQRSEINNEYTSLVAEIDRISGVTDFGGTQLINGGNSIAGGPTPAQGTDNIVFRGAWPTSTAAGYTLSYSTTGDTFTLTDGTNSYTGAISSSALNSGSTALTSGTVVTLTGTSSTNSVDIVLNEAFTPNATHASNSITLGGTASTSFSFQIGAGTTADDQITVSLSSATSTQLGINGTSITSVGNAQVASTLIDNAINSLQNFRALLGASESRLQFATTNIGTSLENVESARSNLLDLDVAQESSNFTSKQILTQLGVSELAQANQLPQLLLKLFQ
ncbi:MAG TPA: flagellin [Alphaproteobacteria bacterium]|nr:flagellin [Alphaproteobacteria bacterium]